MANEVNTTMGHLAGDDERFLKNYDEEEFIERTIYDDEKWVEEILE